MVRRKIIWSHNAQTDRLSILEYWYKKNGNSRYSRLLNKQLLHSINLLKHHQKLGRQLQGSKNRYLVKGHFIISYSINEDYIEVLKIKDSRLDLSNISL